jgi:hypothetical protein
VTGAAVYVLVFAVCGLVGLGFAFGRAFCAVCTGG